MRMNVLIWCALQVHGHPMVVVPVVATTSYFRRSEFFPLRRARFEASIAQTQRAEGDHGSSQGDAESNSPLRGAEVWVPNDVHAVMLSLFGPLYREGACAAGVPLVASCLISVRHRCSVHERFVGAFDRDCSARRSDHVCLR